MVFFTAVVNYINSDILDSSFLGVRNSLFIIIIVVYCYYYYLQELAFHFQKDIYMYIYIFREKEREREIKIERERDTYIDIDIYIYNICNICRIYIYIYRLYRYRKYIYIYRCITYAHVFFSHRQFLHYCYYWRVRKYSLKKFEKWLSTTFKVHLISVYFASTWGNFTDDVGELVWGELLFTGSLTASWCPCWLTVPVVF